MGISRRLANIASAIGGDWKEKAEELLNKGQSRLESELDDWEKKLGIGKENQGSAGYRQRPGAGAGAGAEKKYTMTRHEEDLQVFGLKSGAKWAEVKKAYRSESKKYHVDLHQNDDEKKKVAHEIMLIFNSAYDRLEKDYRQK